MFINGNWIESEDTFAVTNPATGEEIGQVVNGPFHSRKRLHKSRTHRLFILVNHHSLRAVGYLVSCLQPHD